MGGDVLAIDIDLDHGISGGARIAKGHAHGASHADVRHPARRPRPQRQPLRCRRSSVVDDETSTCGMASRTSAITLFDRRGLVEGGDRHKCA